MNVCTYRIAQGNMRMSEEKTALSVVKAEPYPNTS